MTDTRAFWVVRPGYGEIRAETLAAPGPGDLLIRAVASGVSRGTETLVFRGLVPPSQHRVMRCPFQAGDFPGPVKYGYSSVGLVEIGPPELVGRLVFTLHPHQERYVVPAAVALPVPDGVPPARAVLAANLETAVNALWDARPCIGDRIAVVGAGVVGSLVAGLAARLPGTSVELIDLDPARASLAQALGCRFALPGAASGNADLVIHASGDPAGLVTALGLAAFEALVLDLSWYGDRPVSLPLGEAFHSRRLRLQSSQVGAVAPARRAGRSHRDRLELALALLADPVYDRVLTATCRLDDLPGVMTGLASGCDGTLAQVVRYD